MDNHKYILDAKGEPIRERDWKKWAEWFEQSCHDFAATGRRVAREKVGDYEVSTVFLGLNHSFSRKGPPILWESMIFGKGPLRGQMLRCSGGREQAEAMHERMKEYVRRNSKPERKRKA